MARRRFVEEKICRKNREYAEEKRVYVVNSCNKKMIKIENWCVWSAWAQLELEREVGIVGAKERREVVSVGDGCQLKTTRQEQSDVN